MLRGPAIVCVFLSLLASCLADKGVGCNYGDLGDGVVIECTDGRTHRPPEMQTGLAPTLTRCTVHDGDFVLQKTCLVDKWSSSSQEPVSGTKRSTVRAKTPLIRRKRGWGWVRHVGNFFRDVGRAVVQTTSCVLSLMLKCGDGQRRDSPPRDSTPPVLTCPLSKTVIADPYQVTRQVNWTEPMATDDSKQIRPRRVGPGPGRHFMEDNNPTKITYSAKDKYGNSASCSFTVTVKVVRCPSLSPVENGYYLCHPYPDHLLGGSCQFGCYDGFELKGPSEITCMEDGQWNFGQPTCKPFSCQQPPPVPGANLSCSHDFHFRSSCSYRCRPGYDMPPQVSSTIICNRNKIWQKHGQPLCKDVEPPRFDRQSCPSIIIAGTSPGRNSTSSVSWTLPTATDNSGNMVSVSQSRGLHPGAAFSIGTHEIKIEATDAENNTALVPCKFKVIVREIRCPRLYPVPYTHYNCPNGYSYGANCSVSCDPGKVIEGVKTVSCEESPAGMFGQWNWEKNTQTTCKVTSRCESLTPPVNGAVVCDNWLGGEFCQVQCRNGTDMATRNWKQLRVCTGASVWMPALTDRPCKPQLRPRAIVSRYFFYGHCMAEDTKREIAANFVDTLRSSSYLEACPNNLECNYDNVQVHCGAETGTRGRRDTLNSQAPTGRLEFDLKIKSDPQTTYADIVKYLSAVKSALNDAFLNRNSTATNLTQPLSFLPVESLAIDLECPPNSVQAPESFACIDCPEGTYFEASNNSCTSCPKGTYQDVPASSSCQPCPRNTFTRREGAVAADDCEPSCEPGMWSPSGVVPCSMCEVGSYQSLPGMSHCNVCPGGKTTETVGATDELYCKEFDISFPSTTVDSVVSYHPRSAIQLKDFVVSMWLVVPDPVARQHNVLSLVTQGNVTVLQLRLADELLVVLNGTSFKTGASIKDSKWHSIAVQHKHCNLTFFMDGTPTLTTGLGMCLSRFQPESSFIGGDGFVGSISQVNVWSTPVFEQTHGAAVDRCFSGAQGDLLGWSAFSEASLTGAYVQIPSECDDFDDCKSGPCLRGSCVDGLHDYTCSCDAGFTGRNCDVNIDDCVNSICINGATCEDQVESYTCLCPANFTGVYCEIETVDGQWGEWGNWSGCSRTCGDGTWRRRRLCDRPTPDNGGQPCLGDSVETDVCNVTVCPVCVPISPPANGTLSCHDDDRNTNCTILCSDGFEFDIEPMDFYHCGEDTAYEWNFQTDDNPDRRFPKCTPISLPERLTVSYQGSYKDLYCVSQFSMEEIEEQVRQRVESVVAFLPCVKEDLCELVEIKLTGCDSSARTKRNAALQTAGFSVSVSSVPRNNSDTDAVSNLENTVRDLQSAADSGEFTVDVLDDEFFLENNQTTVSGEVECPPGSTRVDYYCVPCGVGAFLSEGYCQPCHYGYYQDLEGQDYCIRCPEHTTTLGTGSVDRGDCSVTVLDTDVSKVTGGVIGGSVAAAVLVVLAVGAAILFKRRRAHIVYKVKPYEMRETVKITTVSSPAKPSFTGLQRERASSSLCDVTD